MRQIIKCLMLLAITLTMVMAFNATAIAWQVNQHYTNNTGQTAYDLTKIIPGTYLITEVMLNRPFADAAVVHIFGFTIIHWYNGTVPPGEMGHACFSTNAPVRPPIVVALWTDASGNFIGYAGPALGVLPWFDKAAGYVKITIGHDWSDWNGIGYPIQEGDGPGYPRGQIDVTQFYYAYSDHGRPLEELNDDLWDDPDLNWIPLPDSNLNYGQEMTFDAGTPEDKYVLFRLNLQGEGMESYDVVQFGLREELPSLTHWGLIILAVLVLASGVWIVLRRKRVARTVV